MNCINTINRHRLHWVFRLIGFFLASIDVTLAASPNPKSHVSAPQVDPSFEILRAQQRTEKRHVLESALDLTVDEGQAFWPIYFTYQANLIRVEDRKYKLIEWYSDLYPEMTDVEIDHFMREWLDIDRVKSQLLKRFYFKMSKTLSKTIAARFLQIEHAWDNSFDLGLESKLPLMPKANTSN